VIKYEKSFGKSRTEVQLKAKKGCEDLCIRISLIFDLPMEKLIVVNDEIRTALSLYTNNEYVRSLEMLRIILEKQIVKTKLQDLI